ncbi:uncharacterized protein LOC127749740 [Frankliniella occidentalis]|uniref:Uncharacterized protein LOC127749740 n=1 Tax=Frankliniella occidentalis TaxID=133901 RepID=A0A9C6U0F7_FRAOC|nr:uncharacterized protein LOC127749740 [Frankliniella occidentalis]
MSNTSFREHFRTDQLVFQARASSNLKLVVVIGIYLRENNKLIRLRTPLDLCIQRAVWPIFNPDTFRTSGLHFKQRRAGMHFHYAYIIEALAALAPRFIKWPDALEKEEIKSDFKERHGYPGVVGAIDGVLFPIQTPLEQPARFQDRHHHYSMLAQAVCNHKLLYRDFYVGEVGGIGDSRNFDRSALSVNLLTSPHLLSAEEHILGDGAYTLTSKMLTPYRNGQMTVRQRAHNFLHSAQQLEPE